MSLKMMRRTRMTEVVIEMSYEFEWGVIKPTDLCPYTLAIDNEVYLQSLSNMQFVNAKSLIALSTFPCHSTETVRLIVKNPIYTPEIKALEEYLEQNTHLTKKRVVAV